MAGHNENERRDFEDWASINGMLPPWSDDQTTVSYQVSRDRGPEPGKRSSDEPAGRSGSGVRRVSRERVRANNARIPSLRAAQRRALSGEQVEHTAPIPARPNTFVGMPPSAAYDLRAGGLDAEMRDEYASSSCSSWLPRTPFFLSAAAFGVLGGLWFGHTTFDAAARAPIGGSGAALAQQRFTAEPETADTTPEAAHAEPARVGSGTDSEPLAALSATSGSKTGSGAKNRHEAMQQRREAAKAKREAAAQARREARAERAQAWKEKREARKAALAAKAESRKAALSEKAEARKAALAEKREAAKAHREELASAHREAAEARKRAQEERREAAKAHHAEQAQAMAERREAAKARREEAAEARRTAMEERREAAKARREEAAEARRVAMEERRERESSDLDTASASGGAQGTLRINSRPWAQVFVDGRLVGYTPQVGFAVNAGRHSVRLVNPTFSMSKIFDVKVAAGESITRIETLED